MFGISNRIVVYMIYFSNRNRENSFNKEINAYGSENKTT